jgi:formylglycine-generating enzyme required for sulfatase activity
MSGKENNDFVRLLLEELTRLLPSQFEVLLVNLNAPVQYLPPREAAQAIRAAELIRWAENVKILDRLDIELNRFRPQSSPVASIPPEPTVVPPAPQPKTFVNSIGMEFVLVPAGDFLMGDDRYKNEKPVRRITIRNPFYFGKYQVTQGAWKAVMGKNPSWFWFNGDDRLPVERVSWHDCQEFISKLNKIEKKIVFRLPSEAEWEYACRAGTTGDYAGNLNEIAWFSNGPLGRFNLYSGTHPVALKKANNFGLYDMHGNVWEWCQDRWHENYNDVSIDELSWESGDDQRRVLRGGSWLNNATYCRSSSRLCCDPSDRRIGIGVRIIGSVRT